MKLGKVRHEPRAPSAAATAASTAALPLLLLPLLLLLLPAQTSGTYAVGTKTQEEQLPPSAFPAARFVLYSLLFSTR